MPDASQNTVTQVNAAYFPSSFFTHILTFIRIQNKQAAGTKTSKHFTESTERKKERKKQPHCVKFNRGKRLGQYRQRSSELLGRLSLQANMVGCKS